MKKTLVLVVGLVLCLSLALDAKPRRYNCEAKIKRAFDKFEQHKYSDVEILLTEVKTQCGGHQAMDTIMYMRAYSLLKQKKYIEAQGEFEQLSREFTTSIYADEAAFRVGYCDFLASNSPDRDQTTTKDAMRKLADFADQYPNSAFADSARVCIGICTNKLAEKEFLNARFYEKTKHYESAIIYYRSIIAGYAQTPFVVKAKLGMAQSLVKVNRYDEAVTVVDDLLNSQIDDETKVKVVALKELIKKTATP